MTRLGIGPGKAAGARRAECSHTRLIILREAGPRCLPAPASLIGGKGLVPLRLVATRAGPAWPGPGQHGGCHEGPTRPASRAISARPWRGPSPTQEDCLNVPVLLTRAADPSEPRKGRDGHDPPRTSLGRWRRKRSSRPILACRAAVVSRYSECQDRVSRRRGGRRAAAPGSAAALAAQLEAQVRRKLRWQVRARERGGRGDGVTD